LIATPIYKYAYGYKNIVAHNLLRVDKKLGQFVIYFFKLLTMLTLYIYRYYEDIVLIKYCITHNLPCLCKKIINLKFLKF
jgi:hypothetical protein